MTDEEARLLNLLTWMSQQEGMPASGLVNAMEFYERDQNLRQRVWNEIEALDRLGYVDMNNSLGGGRVLAQVTMAGRAYVAEVTAKRADRAERQWACRSAVVRWLYDQGAAGS